MDSDAANRMLLEVKEPLTAAFSYLSPHSARIQASWRALLRRFKLCGKHRAALSSLRPAPQARDFSDLQAYREKCERQGQELARSGVSLECVSIAVALFVETCL